MKKLLLFLMFTFSIGVVTNAQNKDKIKKTSSVPQKVHNTFSKHKHHKGYKVKHKHHGVTQKHKVDAKKGRIKEKTR